MDTAVCHCFTALLWSAPELMASQRAGVVGMSTGTQKGDVYSFAIILHEILYRAGLFRCVDDNESIPAKSKPPPLLSRTYRRSQSLLESDASHYLVPYPDHLLPHLSKLQTVLFNMQHPAFGINSLTLSVSLIHILVFHLLITFSLPYTSRIHTLISTSVTINHSFSFSL